MRSLALCMKTWQLFQLLGSMNCHDHSYTLARALHTKADHLSWRKVEATEWSFHLRVVSMIFQVFERPMTYLSTSILNHVHPTFCSWKPSQETFQIEAFILNRLRMLVYAYSHSKGASTSGNAKLRDAFDSSIVTEMVMVLNNFEHVDWFPVSRNILPSESRPFQIYGMENVKQQTDPGVVSDHAR